MDDLTFGFPGTTYLSAANEPIAHGHQSDGREMAARALSWFTRHDADVRRSSTLWLRMKLVVQGKRSATDSVLAWLDALQATAPSGLQEQATYDMA